MSTIDERVVRMEFDNKQFEAGVQTTMGTLAKLKEALNFRKGGFDEVQKSANSVSFGALSDQIFVVQERFSLLGEFARNVFDRISNKVIDTAASLGRSLTIEPIMGGFQEYETQMNSVQTIMANTQAAFADATTEEHLSAVNDALDELNTYADKTIYNFSEMTRNIGTFTAAGVDLETAKSSIQGIANMAAVSGSTSQQASTAMYQLSQAIASGTVRLMDWNSVNNAGMGGQVFQDALKRTAREHGIAVDAMIEKNGSFRESLQEGWLSSEVLTETLSKMTDVGLSKYFADVTGQDQEWIKTQIEAIEETEDRESAIQSLSKKLAESGKITQEDAKQYLDLMITAQDAATKVKTFGQLIDTVKEGLGSGWTQSMEYILGDFEEAKELWSGVYKEIDSIITPISDARNEMLKFWHDAGGRTTAINALSAAWQGVKRIMDIIGRTFSSVFPPMTGQILVDITNKIAGLAEKFHAFANSPKVFNRTTRIFKGLFNTIKMGIGVLKAFWAATQPVREVLASLADDLFSSAAFIGDFLTGVANAESPLQYLIDAINGKGQAGTRLGFVIESITGAIENFGKRLLDLVGIKIEGTPISDFIEKVRALAREHLQFPSLETLKSGAQGILDTLSNLGTFISEKLGGLFSGLGSLFSPILDSSAEAKKSIDEVGEGIDGFAGKFDGLGLLGDLGKGFLDTVTSIAQGLSTFGTVISENLPKVFEYLGSDEFKNLLKSGDLALTGGVLYELLEFVKNLNNKTPESVNENGGLFGFLSSIKEKAENAVDGFGDVLDSLKEKIDAFGHGFGGSALLKITAVVLLVRAIVDLANLEPEKMANGIVGVAAALGILVVAMKSLDAGHGVVVSTGIKALSSSLAMVGIAVGILTISIKALSELNMDQLTTGLLGIAGAMGVMVVGVEHLAKNGGKLKTSATSMVLIAVAIRVLASSVKAMSEMGEKLAGGLTGVGILLAELAAFSKFVDSSSLTIRSAISILALAGVIKILESSVKVFAAMSWDSLTKGLEGVGVLLGAFAVFSVWANTESLTIRSAINILLLSAALKVLESSVTTFASLDDTSLSNGLSGIGVLLAEVAVFAALISKVKMGFGSIVALVAVVGTLTVLSGVVKTMSKISSDAMGTGIFGIAAALAVLAGALVAFAAVGGLGGQIFIGVGALMALCVALNLFIPIIQAFTAIPEDDIASGLLLIAGALAVLGFGAAALGAVAPFIFTGALALGALGAACIIVAGGLLAISANLLAFIGTLSGSAAALAANAGAMSIAIVSLITAIGVGLGSGLTGFVVTIFNGIGDITEAFGSMIHRVGDFIINEIPYMMTVGVRFFLGFLDAVLMVQPALIAVISKFVITLIQTLVTWIPPLANTLVTGTVVLLNSVANGIRDNGPQILAAVRNILSSAIELVMTALSDIVRLIPGVGPMLADQIDGAKEDVRAALAPETLESTGKEAMGGVASGIEAATPEIQNAAEGAGNTVFDAFSSPLNDPQALADGFTGPIVQAIAGADGEFLNASTGNAESYYGGLSTAADGGLVANEMTAPVLEALGVDEEFLTKGLGGGGAYGEGLEEGLPDAGLLTDNYTGAILSGLSSADGDFYNVASDSAGMYGEGYLDGSSDPNSLGVDYSAAVAAGESSMDRVHQASGAGNAGAYALGLSSVDPQASGSNMSSMAARGAGTQTGAWRSAASSGAGAYTSTLRNANASGSGVALGTSGAGGASSTRGSWASAGGYVAEGFNWNIASPYALSLARSRGSSLASTALSAIKTTIRSASPSKVTQKYGRWVSEGFAIGIEQFSKYAERSGAKLGQNTLDALAVSAEAIADYAKMDYDIDPTIKPVLDLTEIQNGVSKANSLVKSIDGNVALGLDGTSYAKNVLGGMTVSARNPMQDLASTLAEQNAQNLSEVMKSYSSESGQAPKVEINVYGVTGPDEVGDVISRKLTLLGLV